MNPTHSDAEYRIVALVFAGRAKARAVDEEIEQAGTYQAFQVVAHTVAEVDDKGKAHFHESGRGALGSGLGAGIGALLGLAAGPAGVVLLAAAGAAIGGVAGHHAGRPIPTEDLKKLATRVPPDSSAVLALVEETQAEALVAALAHYDDAKVAILAVSEDDAGELHVATALPGESRDLVQATSDEIHHAAALPGQAAPHSS